MHQVILYFIYNDHIIFNYTVHSVYSQCLLDTQSLECVFQNDHRLGG